MTSWIKNHFLSSINQNAKTILVIRHGHREEITTRSFGNETSLTKEGEKSSFEFGTALKKITLGEVHTSPLKRCVQTTEELLKGASQNPLTNMSKVLGDPGLFIEDPLKAGPIFLQRPLETIAQDIADKKLLPGMRSLFEGGQIFIDYLLQIKQFPCVMISHDVIICLLCCFLFQSTNIKMYMPDFLDGFGLVIHSDFLSIHHQHQQRVFTPSSPLFGAFEGGGV